LFHASGQHKYYLLHVIKQLEIQSLSQGDMHSQNKLDAFGGTQPAVVDPPKACPQTQIQLF
jgi:hypothetical protein